MGRVDGNLTLDLVEPVPPNNTVWINILNGSWCWNNTVGAVMTHGATMIMPTQMGMGLRIGKNPCLCMDIFRIPT